MTQNKPVTVEMIGGGDTYETEIQPGDTPRDVLARTVEGNPEEFLLRRGSEPQFPHGIDLFRQVKENDELNTATKPVVGHHH